MNTITTISKIAQIITDLKSKGLRIAFTNGCFDIVHRGHIEYLEKAKQYADILVVGLNSDDSVRRLKGNARPYIDQDDRAFILSRLECVDVVCIFEEDTPENLIKKVRPDYLIKGGDYSLEEIVGRADVEKYGGKVLTIPFINGKSTSNIIKLIKNE